MIEPESIKEHADLSAFLDAKDKLELLCANRLLKSKKLYAVRQRPPLDRVTCHPAIYLIAAIGTVEQMNSFLLLHYPNVSTEDVLKFYLYAVRNLNYPVYDFLCEQYKLKTQLEAIAKTIKEQNQPITMRNHLTELLNAATMAGNETVVDMVLNMDSTGYIALGIQTNEALKYTPLYYAALGNHLVLFDRLISIQMVREQFESCYTSFCHFIERPSPELKRRLLNLRPTSPAPSRGMSLLFSVTKMVDIPPNAEDGATTPTTPSDAGSLSYSVSRVSSSVQLSRYASDDDNQSEMGEMISETDGIDSPFSSKGS